MNYNQKYALTSAVHRHVHLYNCTNAVIIAQVLIVCNALAIAMFRTKKTSSMASSIPAFGFLSQETMYVLYIMYN